MNSKLTRTESSPREGAQAIARALDIMTLLAMGHSPKWGLKAGEISAYLGIARPTTYRILSALEARGFAQKNEKSGRYVIGEQIPLLALARGQKLPFLQAAEPYLQEVSAVVDDTVFFSIRNGNDVLTLARIVGQFPIQVLSIDVGDRRPLGGITSGVAMLAKLPDAESTALIEEDEKRLAAFQFKAQEVIDFTRETRDRGFAYRQRGLIPGTKAIAVAVGTPEDPIMGAITVSGMEKRMTQERVDEIIGDVMSICERMARRLNE